MPPTRIRPTITDDLRRHLERLAALRREHPCPRCGGDRIEFDPHCPHRPPVRCAYCGGTGIRKEPAR